MEQAGWLIVGRSTQLASRQFCGRQVLDGSENSTEIQEYSGVQEEVVICTAQPAPDLGAKVAEKWPRVPQVCAYLGVYECVSSVCGSSWPPVSSS